VQQSGSPKERERERARRERARRERARRERARRERAREREREEERRVYGRFILAIVSFPNLNRRLELHLFSLQVRNI
jgi:hypothetical protein